MRNFSRLLAVGALIAATIGVAPAGAAKPEPPTPPTIDIDIAWDDPHDPDYPAAVCSPDFSFSVENIVVTGGELNDFNIHVARIGKVKPDVIAYEPTQQQKQWDFGYWSGSNDPTPIPPYTLDTADPWPGSWTHHSEIGPPDIFESTPFWEVGVWAGAVNTSGKGNRRNQTWVWADISLTVDCTTGTPLITENSGFTWCFEDEWTHESYPDEGLMSWTEGEADPVTCPWLPES